MTRTLNLEMGHGP